MRHAKNLTAVAMLGLFTAWWTTAPAQAQQLPPNQGKAGKGKPGFTVPPGIKVELAVKLPDNDPKFSLVNMCFDARGRLLVSREGGPIYLCTSPDKVGVMQEVRVYCDQVKNSQGMC